MYCFPSCGPSLLLNFLLSFCFLFFPFHFVLFLSILKILFFIFSQDCEVNKKVKKYELNRVWAVAYKVAYKDIHLDEPF